jgi:hypothetical protein
MDALRNRLYAELDELNEHGGDRKSSLHVNLIDTLPSAGNSKACYAIKSMKHGLRL